MKTIKFFSAALFVLAASACNPDYTTENFSNLEPMTIAGAQTRTSLNQTNGSVNWTADDQIAIYDNLGGENIFTNTSENVASFTGNVTAGTTQFWGVYPTDLITDFNNGTVTMTLPSDQTPVAGTFAEELNISVTSGMKTPGTELVKGISFHNACGLISFTVPANIAAQKVTFISDNSFISGTLTVNCATSEAVLKSNQSNSVSMTGDFDAGSTFYFVVAPGQIEGFSINVETKNGSYYSKSASNGSINVTAGSLTRLGQISFKAGAVTASAEHTYDEDYVLIGSSLSVNHGIPQNMWKDVENLSVIVAKEGTEYRDIYREYSKSSIDSTSVVPLGKTYLPQGRYDIKVEYTMNGVLTTAGTITVTLGKPNFTGEVSVSGTTSFSLFENGNINGANDHNAETISNITATCDAVNKISPTVLAECPVNYSITLDDSASITSGTNKATVSFGEKKDVAWGSHTLAASFTFDGITLSNKTTCHITGLPHVSVPPTNSGIKAWEGSANMWESGYVRLHKNTISQTFHVPENINVSVTHRARLYTRSDDTRYTLSLSGSTLYNLYQESYIPATKTTNINETYNSTITSSNPTISAKNTFGTGDAVLEYTNVKVYEITLKYR